MQMIEISRSAVIPVPVQRVWALVRDFNAMPEWNPSVRSSRIEDGPAERIGCKRVLTFDDGSQWTHRLTDLSDAEMTISYAITGMPPVTKIAMRNYRATIRLEGNGDQCRITWQAWLETDAEDVVRERAQAVFQAGFDGLTRRLA